MSLMVAPAELARRQQDEADDYYQVGQAHALLIKTGAAPVAAPILHGRLFVSASGWGLLSVPNALVRGLFDAVNEPGAELPLRDGKLNAHISVFTDKEVEKLGGPSRISERGHPFSYQLGPIMAVDPKGWAEMSKAWFVRVSSPELKALRKSYGLDPLPNGDHEFHITIGVRRKNVLKDNEVSKAAADKFDDAQEDDGPADDGRAGARIPLAMIRVTQTTIIVPRKGDGEDPLAGLMDRIRSRCEKQGALPPPIGDVKPPPAPAVKPPPAPASAPAPAVKPAPAPTVVPDQPRRTRPRYRPSTVPDPPPVAASPNLPPRATLASRVAPYYKDVPGGFPGALQRAEANQVVDAASPNRWRAGDAYTEFPIRYPASLRPGLLGSTNTQTNRPSPASIIDVRAPEDPNNDAQQRLTLEHELTHAALQGEPAARADRAGFPNLAPAMNPKFRSGRELIESRGGTAEMPPMSHADYTTSLEELGPRLAEIKRFYAQNTGKDVTTPAEAQDAMKWYRGYMETPEGQQRGVSTQDWKRMFALPDWPQVEPEALRRMPGLVANPAAAGAEKAAGAFDRFIRAGMAGGRRAFDATARTGRRIAAMPAALGRGTLENARFVAGLPAAVSQTGRDALAKTRSLAGLLPDQPFAPTPRAGAANAAKAVGQGARDVGQATWSKARGLAGLEPGMPFAPTPGAGLANTGRALGGGVREGARFAAGLPEGQPFFPSVGGTLKNVGKIAFKPRYPGLDRPLGLTEMARPLDRTRAALGTGLRRGSVASMGLSVPAALHGALWNYPGQVGDQLAAMTGRPEDADKLRAQMRWEAPGAYASMARDALAAPFGMARQDPTSKLVRGVTGDVAGPFLLAEVHGARQTKPLLMGTIDALRSTTPFGWLMTRGIKALGSEAPVPLSPALARHMPAYTASVALNPESAYAGPYGAAARNIAPLVNVSGGHGPVPALSGLGRLALAPPAQRPGLAIDSLRRLLPKRLPTPAIATMPPPGFGAEKGGAAPDGEKQAARYVFHGDVQGVGLRRVLHQILDEHGRPGMAYNDARAGKTIVDLPGRARSHGPVFRALDAHLKGRGADYSFAPEPGRERHQPHAMTDADTAHFFRSQGMTKMEAEPPEVRRRWVADRYRLGETPEGQLEGALPPLAAAQLKGEQPIYAEQLTGEGGYGPNAWSQAAEKRAGLWGPRRIIRHMAGVGPDQGFMQRPIRNTFQVLTNPRLPGLQRELTAPAPHMPLFPDEAPKPRWLDRTRQGLGNAARISTATAQGASGLAIGYGLLAGQGREQAAAHAILGELKVPDSEYDAAHAQLSKDLQGLRGPMNAQLFGNIPGVNALTGKPDPSAAGQMVGDVAAETAWPFFRHNYHVFRKQNPLLTGAIDAGRIFSPTGLAMSALGQVLPREEPADYRGAFNRAFERHRAELEADPIRAATSPLVGPIVRGLSDPAIRPYVAQHPEFQKLVANAESDPRLQQLVVDRLAGPATQETLAKALADPRTKQMLMTAVADPKVQQLLANAAADPRAQQLLIDALKRPDVQQSLAGALDRPDVRRALIQTADRPEVRQAITGAVAGPEIQSRISGETAGAVHRQVRNILGIGAAAPAGAPAAAGPATDPLGAAMPAARAGLGEGLRASWADPEVRNRVGTLGLAAGGGALGGGLLGHLAGAAFAPDSRRLTYEERRSRERRRAALTGLAALAGGVAAPYLAYRAGQKTAALDPKLVGGLAGSGLGGLLGYGVGKIRGAEHPWVDALIGAGIGGVGGAHLGSRPVAPEAVTAGPLAGPDVPPPLPLVATRQSLAENVERYYRNVPQGFRGAVARARAAFNPGASNVPPWDERDVDTRFSVTGVTPAQARAEPRLQGLSGLRRGVTYAPPLADGSYGQPRILKVVPGGAGTGVDRDVLEHELTHAATQQQPLIRLLNRPDLTRDQLPQLDVFQSGANLFDALGLPPHAAEQLRKVPILSYLTSPAELGPRLAVIKRHYAQATGQDVHTPEQAEKALDWFHARLSTPEGRAATDPLAGWGPLFQLMKVRQFRDEVKRIMPGLVHKAPALPETMKAAAADYAPGLPAKDNLGPFDRLRVGQMLDYIVQKHDAERAGPHHDIRFGNPEMGLLSWAARKGVPAPGEKHLAVQQPVHRHGYKDFEGTIAEGYGKGTVKKHDEGQVLITKVTPESVHFTTAHRRHPERFTLARPKGWGDRNWLLMNTTPREEVPYEKVRYKKIAPEHVEPALKAMQEGDSAEAKVDGASSLIRLAKGHAEALSYRTSKTTGRPIIHTERLFGGRPEVKVPPHLEGSILKGEMYATRGDHPDVGPAAPGPGGPGMPALGGAGGGRGTAARTAGGDRPAPVRTTPQDVGTLLNSGIARSLQLQRERGLTLRNMLYDVQRYGKRDVDPATTPRAERRKMLEEIVAHLPADKFHLSEAAHGPEAATKLWDMIRTGQHPLTEEGAVIHPAVGVPSKAKLFDEHDVHITGTFPGEGRRAATVGGLTYGHEPGKTVGKVGTGFSDETLAEIARDPSAYVGRVARLRAQQKLPSGALRVPSFIGLHEDINAPTKAAAAPASDFDDDADAIPRVDVPEPAPIRRRHRKSPPWLRAIMGGPRALWNRFMPDVVSEIVSEQQDSGKVASAHPALADLKRAKAESDRRNYAAKNKILSKLLDKRRDEFVVDSRKGRFFGLTHKQTGFRIHAPVAMVGSRVKAAGLEDILKRIGPAIAVEGVGTGVDTVGNAVNNPDHPWTSAGRALSTGLGTVGGTALGAYLGNRYGPGLGLGPHTSEVGGAVAGALAGGVGGTALGRWLIPGSEAGETEEERRRRLALAEKQAKVPEIVIDRPKGFEKTFRTSSGPVKAVYPLDYGYYKGLINPQDKEEADVFVGSGGPRFGRYMKGNMTSGTWRPDEFKWYKGLTDREHKTMMDWYNKDDPGLTRDDTPFKSEAELLADIRKVRKAAAAPETDHADPRTAGVMDPPRGPGAARGAEPHDLRDALPQVRKSAGVLGEHDRRALRPRPPEPLGVLRAAHASLLHQGVREDPLRGGGPTPGEKWADLLPWVNLQPQQRRVARKVRQGQNLLVYHGLGTGKSLASLAAAEGVGGPYTAVVPASLRPNYEGEIRKFTTQTTPSEVMSYTGVGMGKQPRITPSTVIMDEVQRIRNPESEGSRAAMDLAMKAPHKVLLSGTPIVNAPGDLAVPLSILTGKPQSPATFNKKFIGSETVHPGLWGWLQGIKPAKTPKIQNEEDLERMLEGHVDYQPAKTPAGVKTNDERVEVDLSPEQQEFYKLMWGRLPWMMRWKMSNDYPMTKQELAHLTSFMSGPRQAALSLYPFHASRDPMHAFRTSAKLRAAMGSLKQTLAQDPRAKALVYSNFIDAGLTPYAAALRHARIPFGQFHGSMNDEDRKKALDDYNAGRLRVLLLGPAAAEGISAKGTQLIQLLDPHWNEARLGQARGRGLRFDSHEGLPEELRNVRIQRFVAKMPPPGFFGRLFGAKPRPSADEVLEQQSRRKEELNEQFREVLRRVGSPGYQRPWHLFG
jgi:hypothetical protein